MITCIAQTAQSEARLHSTLLFSGRLSKLESEFQPTSHIGALFEQDQEYSGVVGPGLFPKVAAWVNNNHCGLKSPGAINAWRAPGGESM